MSKRDIELDQKTHTKGREKKNVIMGTPQFRIYANKIFITPEIYVGHIENTLKTRYGDVFREQKQRKCSIVEGVKLKAS